MPKTATLPRLASVNRLVRLARDGYKGAIWYAESGSLLRDYAQARGWDVERFACVLSITSPRVHVLRNWSLATHYMEHGRLPDGVMISIHRALQHFERTGEIRGPKTWPFAAALLGDRQAIVLDSWMAKAFGIDQDLLSRVRVHAECCRRVRAAARRLGWAPCEVQAAVWRAVVEAHGRRPGSYARAIALEQGRTS